MQYASPMALVSRSNESKTPGVAGGLPLDTSGLLTAIDVCGFRSDRQLVQPPGRGEQANERTSECVREPAQPPTQWMRGITIAT
jgi:hypothetical protein